MHVLAEIAWDPEIRNILALLLGVAVLVGSIVLIVGSNTGPRTGLLVVMACLFGWLTLMSTIWVMYGIGPKGQAPKWKVVEINTGSLADANNSKARSLPPVDQQAIVNQIFAAHPDLKQKSNPDNKAGKITSVSELIELDPSLKQEFHLTPSDLGGWRILNPSDKQRGDAQAAADAALVPAEGPKVFNDPSEYHVLEAYDIGGKRQLAPTTGDCKLYKPSTYGDCVSHVWDDIYSGVVQVKSPPHYALVQVQAVVPQETKPGQAPPPAVIDTSAPVVSVIMVRDLGYLRLPSFLVLLVSAAMFALTCNTLHRRDKLQAAHLAAAAAAS